MPTLYKIMYMEYIERIEKSRNKKSKKDPENNILNDYKKMSMKNILYLFIWCDIWCKEKGLKSIHN